MDNYIYLSHFINNNTPVYGGANEIEIRETRAIKNGDTSNNKYLSFPNHTGTHIDFPNHFSADGKTVNDYPPDFWIWKNVFILNHLATEDTTVELSEMELDNLPKETDFLIINTGFQKFRGEKKYWNNNPGLSPCLAKKLKTRCSGLKAIGFDLISISGYQNRPLGREAHKQFLVKNDILIIEDMDLQNLPDKIQEIICLPLLIEKVDGGPVTIIAKPL